MREGLCRWRSVEVQFFWCGTTKLEKSRAAPNSPAFAAHLQVHALHRIL